MAVLWPENVCPMATTVALKSLGPKGTTKKLAYWIDPLGQSVFKKIQA